MDPFIIAQTKAAEYIINFVDVLPDGRPPTVKKPAGFYSVQFGPERPPAKAHAPARRTFTGF